MARKTLKAAVKNTAQKTPKEASELNLKTPTGRTRVPPKSVHSLMRPSRTITSNAPPAFNAPPALKSVRAQQFGQLLKAAMVAKGLKQIQLAELVGVPRDSISGYCKGENIPANDRLKKIADALGVRPDELLPINSHLPQGGDPKMTVYDQGNGKSWLQIARTVSSRTALVIQELIMKEDEALARKSKS